MDKQTILDTIKNIGTCEDDATRRTMLADFEKDLSADYDRLSELETTTTDLNSQIEKLRNDNMQLFLSIGSKAEPDRPGTDNKKEPLTYEALFNDKGELK